MSIRSSFSSGGGGGSVSGTAGALARFAADADGVEDADATDDADEFAVDGNTLKIDKNGNKVIITRGLGDGGWTHPHGSLVVQTGGLAVTPGGEGDDGGVQSFVTTTFNLGPGETAQTLALYAGNSASKVDADGALTNYGILANVVGGDENYSFYAVNGDFFNGDGGQFGGLLTLHSIIAGAGSEFQVANTGEVTLGSKVQNFVVTPPNGTTPTIAIGGQYASGCQVTTKNRVAGVNVAGIDIGLDTTVSAAIRGGLHIWRGANGGFGGANELGLVFAGGNDNYIIGATAGDACLFNTTPNKKLLLSSDGSGFTVGAQLDGNGVLQAKALRTGSAMGTGARWTSGNGTPEGAVNGSIGDLFTRLDGGAGTTLYVKESGAGTNTGWVAK